MNRGRQIIAAGALIAGTIVGVGAAAGVEAGEIVANGALQVDVYVNGAQAPNIADVIPEAFDSGGSGVDCVGNPTPGSTNPVYSSVSYDCTLPIGDYNLGLRGVFDDYVVSANCFTSQVDIEQLVDPAVTFSIVPFATTNCNVFVGTTTLFLTKEVTDPFEFVPAALAAPEDFTLEVFDSGGAPFASGSVATDAGCEFVLGAGVECFYVDLPDGDYSLGEVPIPGYTGSVAECLSRQGVDEIFPDPRNETVTALADPFGLWVSCEIVNRYGEGDVSLTKTLTNDDGGTATMGDFTLELFRGGSLIASGVCADTGVCLEGSYPTGDYVVGETGPDGYTRTVTQQIVIPTEQLSDGDAAFALEVFAEVSVNVASDDIATTTTTVAPTTTLAPTTLAPTTTIDFGAGAGTLPATGQTDQTATLALLALGLLMFGGGAVLIARRR